MAAQPLSLMPSRVPLAELSLDEIRFLRSCDKRWFELSPVKAAAIIGAARNLILDLIHEGDERVGPGMQGRDRA